MLRYPIIRDWFEINLGNDGTYTMTNEHPNRYMENALNTIDLPQPNFQPVKRIDRGLYKAGAGPYLTDPI
jgi:hypothetical protein